MAKRCRSCCAGTTATFSGTLKGCNGLSGIVITLKDHSSGTAMGTVTTTTGGLFSGSVAIPASPTSVDFTTTGVARFADFSSTKSLVSGSNAVGTLTLTPASGYHCWTTNSSCAYPLKDSMTITNTVNGTTAAGHAFNFTTGGWADTGGSSLSTSTGFFQMANGSCNVSLGATPDTGSLVCPTTTAATFSARWTLHSNSGACVATVTYADIAE